MNNNNNFYETIKIINELSNDKDKYNNFINNNIVNNFDNENYKELIKKYLL